MIKNLIFDMGGVLLVYDPPRFIREAGITDPTDKELLLRKVFYGDEWAGTDRGDWTEPYVADTVLPQLPEHLRDFARRMIFGWNEPVLPMEGMADFIRRKKEEGYHIYLLSNVSTRFYDYWEKIPGHEYFDGKVISSEIHLVKPSVAIFQHILDKYQLNPSECLFIDDMPGNCEGARSAGLQAFNFKGKVSDLSEYLEKIK